MRKKIFTFLLALAASVGMMWAETVVVINKSEFTSSGVTKEGVTLALSSGSMTSSDPLAMDGSFEFSTSLGKFTGITIETDINIMEIYEGAFTSAGWPTGDNLGTSAVWTGESETVFISCMVAGMDITITCTIEPAPTTEDPAGPIVIATNTGQSSYTQGSITVSVGNVGDSDGFRLNDDNPASISNSGSSTISKIELVPGWFLNKHSYVRANGAQPNSSSEELITFLNVNSNEVTLSCSASIYIKEVRIYFEEPQPVGDGKLPGAFSVSASKKVNFSQGNLRATTADNGTTWTWAFAANQLTFVGNATANTAINGNGTVSANGTVDLFGWSTAATKYGINNSLSNSTYSGDFVDWGSNPDLIASLGEGWRTLTSAEWTYLLNTRTTTSGVRYAKAIVDGKNGLIILPDDWSESYHALASANTDDVAYTYNTFDAAIWSSDFEAHGAVFLPAAGYRRGKDVEHLGVFANYWSASPDGAEYAYYLSFNESLLYPAYNYNRVTGEAVRLVSDIPQYTITPNEDPKNTGVYYSTFFDSSVKYELPAGVEAYVADLSGANLLLTKIAEAGEVIPANVAVILKSTVTPFTLAVSDAEAVTFTATNDLQGSDTQIATPDNCYVLAGTDGVVGFYHYTAANLNAHKAYVVYSGSNQAPRRMPFIFDQATGVENVQNSDIRSQKVVENGQLIIIRNGVRYNAAGQIVK